MSDPISIAASVIALVHAVRKGRNGLSRLRSCFNASPEIARLQARMESLARLLDAVESFVQNGKSNGTIGHTGDLLRLPLENATSQVNSVNKIVESPAFGRIKLSDKYQARIVLLRHQSKFKCLEEDINASLNEIDTRLSFVAADASGQILQALKIGVAFQEKSADRIAAVEKLVHFHIASIRAGEARQIEDSKSKIDMTQLKFGQEQKMADSNHALPLEKGHETLQNQSLETLDGPVFKKIFSCRPGCKCVCHIRREYSFPWLVNSLLGELSLYWRSQVSGVQCNCSGQPGCSILYRFPKYLVQRYISIMLRMTYLDGPELILRVPRILPWTHLLWRYSVCGDLTAIRRMYAERKASPFDVDPAGRNALLYASKQQSAKVVQYLLDEKADLDQVDIQGRAPSELLLKRSFGQMYGEHSEDIRRRVLNTDDSLDEFGFTDLHKIVLGYNSKKLRTVLEATTDTIEWRDSFGRSALFWAVICDKEDDVRVLLHHGADPNAKDHRGYTPLDFVRGPSVCKMLLEKGGTNNVNPKNWHHSSLHEQVIENGCPETMACFADAGFDIDIKDHDDETPLLNAIYAGHTAVVKLLIERGADVNNANKSSRDSALHFAANFDRPEILQMLLQKEADYNALDCNGRNLAHCAARTGSTKLVRIMTDSDLSGLDHSLEDSDGKSPTDYINKRIVMTDDEIGVHEAWEELVAKLSVQPPPRYSEKEREGLQRVIEEVTETEDQGWTTGYLKVPGAFPVETVREIGVFAA